MKEPYLLHDTPEAKEMRARVKDLLLSSQEANIELAFQILRGGGVPYDLIPFVWTLAYTDLIPYRRLSRLLAPYLTEKQSLLFKSLRSSYRKHTHIFWDMSTFFWGDEALQKIAEHQDTHSHHEDFCLAFLFMARLGGRYILRGKFLPENTVIERLTEAGYLSLRDFDLPALPAYISHLADLHTLDLRGNKIRTLPDEFARLKGLKTLYFDVQIGDFTMPEETLAKLERFFPHILAEHNRVEGWNFIDQNDMEKAIRCFEKATQIESDNHINWNDLAWAFSHAHQFEKAFEASDKAIALADNHSDKASYLSNKASDQQRAGFDTCIESAQAVFTLLDNIPRIKWENSDYFSYALSLQIAGKYQEALDCYDLYEQQTGVYLDGSFFYNKACVYARLGDKEEMANMIRQTIDSDSINWVSEMRHDFDFQAFWDDPIIDELTHYYQETRGLSF